MRIIALTIFQKESVSGCIRRRFFVQRIVRAIFILANLMITKSLSQAFLKTPHALYIEVVHQRVVSLAQSVGMFDLAEGFFYGVFVALKGGNHPAEVVAV
jgi:hypothetical protein